MCRFACLFILVPVYLRFIRVRIAGGDENFRGDLLVQLLLFGFVFVQNNPVLVKLVLDGREPVSELPDLNLQALDLLFVELGCLGEEPPVWRLRRRKLALKLVRVELILDLVVALLPPETIEL